MPARRKRREPGRRNGAEIGASELSDPSAVNAPRVEEVLKVPPNEHGAVWRNGRLHESGVVSIRRVDQDARLGARRHFDFGYASDRRLAVDRTFRLDAARRHEVYLLSVWRTARRVVAAPPVRELTLVLAVVEPQIVADLRLAAPRFIGRLAIMSRHVDESAGRRPFRICSVAGPRLDPLDGAASGGQYPDLERVAVKTLKRDALSIRRKRGVLAPRYGAFFLRRFLAARKRGQKCSKHGASARSQLADLFWIDVHVLNYSRNKSRKCLLHYFNANENAYLSVLSVSPVKSRSRSGTTKEQSHAVTTHSTKPIPPTKNTCGRSNGSGAYRSAKHTM